MSAAAPVRCPACNSVVFALVYGLGEGVCCKQRIEAVRETITSEVRIIKVDRPEKRLGQVRPIRRSREDFRQPRAEEVGVGQR